MITQEHLKTILSYDSGTGEFTWIVKYSRKVTVGTIAGCQTAAGYIVIGIDGVVYYAHRLAWLWMTGVFVPCVDHRDGNGFNNSWLNLRSATVKQNARNSRRASSNTSGLKGVSWHRVALKWAAHINIDGKKKHLGLFENPNEAHAAYVAEASFVDAHFARAS